ncbi:MAG: hypothetical protein Alis3KO_16300 [Aliiglaciecola sp.]
MKTSIKQLLIIFALSVPTLATFSAPSSNAKLQELWRLEGKFNMPESAAYDAQRQMIYVSNVNEYAKDSNGFISRVSARGKHLEVEWMTGLHSPTGLAVKGDKLYAVDYDALVVIDLRNNKIIMRAPAVDAEQIPVLNDVALAENGDVYVSGSRSRTIYKLVENKLEVWVKDDELLKTANGLLVYQNILYHGGNAWTAFDIETRRPVKSLTEMGEGLVDIDGITADGTGGFIVSLIDDHRLWSLKKGVNPKPLTEDEVKGIDMQFVPQSNLLFLPRVGNTLSAYRLSID